MGNENSKQADNNQQQNNNNNNSNSNNNNNNNNAPSQNFSPKESTSNQNQQQNTPSSANNNNQKPPLAPTANTQQQQQQQNNSVITITPATPEGAVPNTNNNNTNNNNNTFTQPQQPQNPSSPSISSTNLNNQNTNNNNAVGVITPHNGNDHNNNNNAANHTPNSNQSNDTQQQQQHPPGFNPGRRASGNTTTTTGATTTGQNPPHNKRGASAFKEQLQQTNQHFGLAGTGDHQAVNNRNTHLFSPGATQTNLPNYDGASGNAAQQQQQQSDGMPQTNTIYPVVVRERNFLNNNNNNNTGASNKQTTGTSTGISTSNDFFTLQQQQTQQLPQLQQQQQQQPQERDNNNHNNIVNTALNQNTINQINNLNNISMTYALTGSIQFGAMIKNNMSNVSLDALLSHNNVNNFSTVVGTGMAPQAPINNPNVISFHGSANGAQNPNVPGPTTTGTIEAMMLNLNNLQQAAAQQSGNGNNAIAILDNKNLIQLGILLPSEMMGNKKTNNNNKDQTNGNSNTNNNQGNIFIEGNDKLPPTNNVVADVIMNQQGNNNNNNNIININNNNLSSASNNPSLFPQNCSGQYLLSAQNNNNSMILPLQSQQTLLGINTNSNTNSTSPTATKNQSNFQNPQPQQIQQPLHTAVTAQQLREACSGLRMLLRNASRELSEEERRAIKELYDVLPHDILTNNESKLQRERVAAMWKEAFSDSRFQDTFSDEFDKLSNNMQGALFASTDIRQQARALSGMITQAMQVLNNPPSLQSLLRVLGAKHGMYGVDQKHFSFMGSALTRTLQTILGDRFTAELQQEWSRIYSMLAQAMVHAQKEHNSNTAMAAQFRRKALQLYLTNFSRHVSRLLATIRKRAPRSDILVLCEAWMNKSSPQQILNLRPLEYKNPYNVRDHENFENSGNYSASSKRSHSSKTATNKEDETGGSTNEVSAKKHSKGSHAPSAGGAAGAATGSRSKTPQPSTAATRDRKEKERDRQGNNAHANQYPSVTPGGGQALTIQNLTGIVAAAATAAAEPLARFLTDVIENSLRAVDVELLDQGAANSTPALLMWLRTAYGSLSDKEMVKCVSHGFTTVMLHGTSANDPNVAWVDSHLQKGLLSGLHQLQSAIPFMPLVGPFAVMQIRIEEFRRLLKVNGKKMRFTVKEIDRLLTACLAACQCHRIQTEREDVEDVSNSVIIAAHVWQLVALSVMLNTTISNLPEMPALTITGLNLRGQGPSFRRDLPRLCIAIHQSSAASPVPRYSPADPYRIVGVSMSELNSLSLGTAGGQCLMSPEAYRSLRLEKHLHREGKLTSPPLVGNNLKITLPQLDWSTFTIDAISAVVRIHGGKDERPPLLHSITLRTHRDREFPRPMLYGSSMRIASRSDEEDEEGGGGGGGGNNNEHEFGARNKKKGEANDFYALDD